MIDYETIARSNHKSGMNCSMAVYDALYMRDETNRTDPPRPRSIDGKCGAILAAEQYIRENGGTESQVEEFEAQFIAKYEHLKCAELRGILGGKCNEYVGAAASIVAGMGLTTDKES